MELFTFGTYKVITEKNDFVKTVEWNICFPYQNTQNGTK